MFAIRRMEEADIEVCADIMFRAFNDMARRYGHRREFSSESVAEPFVRHHLCLDPSTAFVATMENRISGFAFLRTRGEGASIGPVAVAPEFQSKGIGRELVATCVNAARSEGASSIRLLQTEWNLHSYKLYSNCGFVPVTPVTRLLVDTGSPPLRFARSSFRLARVEDLPNIVAMEERLTGVRRDKDLAMLARLGKLIVAPDYRGFVGLCPFARGGMVGPGVADSEELLRELLHSALSAFGPDQRVQVFLPIQHERIIREMQDNGASVLNQMRYMVRGVAPILSYAHCCSLLPESH
ncbi:MAG: GNAT family N-acetyltransferase [Candidatus Binatia bacterium]